MIFGRNVGPLSAEFQPEYARLLLKKQSQWCAVAHNLRYDSRVSEKREEAVKAHMDAQPGSPSFQKRLSNHFGERVRYTDSPEFGLSSLNGANFVGSSPDFPFPPDIELVHFVNLSRMVGMFEYNVFPPNWDSVPRNDLAFKAWLDTGLKNKTSDEQKDFAWKWILEARNYSIRQQRFEPMWATRKDALDHAAIGTARKERWLELVGVTAEPEEWVVRVEYRAREAGRLFRPSVLESNQNPKHILCDPDRSTSSGGDALDLGAAKIPAVPEYIHYALEYTEDQVKDVFQIGPAAVGGSVVLQRRAHHDTLVNKWPPTCLPGICLGSCSDC